MSLLATALSPGAASKVMGSAPSPSLPASLGVTCPEGSKLSYRHTGLAFLPEGSNPLT
jgi:hypothetical protein